eukprot:28640-Eustigmatos_ZCMA.PRE.1
MNTWHWFGELLNAEGVPSVEIDIDGAVGFGELLNVEEVPSVETGKNEAVGSAMNRPIHSSQTAAIMPIEHCF